MEIYPLKNYVAKVNILNRRAFGWLRFSKHRNWITLNSEPLEFYFALTSKMDPISEWGIKFVDQQDEIENFYIEESHRPYLLGITDYPNLKAEEKRFFKVMLNTAQKKQIFTCVAEHGATRHEIFNFYPSLSFPSFLFEACQILLPSISSKPFNNLVETGSLFGHTSLHASNWFDKVYSIEVSQELHDLLPVDWALKRGVEFIKGDTAKVLPDLCLRLDGPTVFFLDAHWSGGEETKWEQSTFVGYPVATSHRGGEGVEPTPNEQKPLIEELEVILKTFKYEALLILDDWSLVGQKDAGFEGLNWTHISKNQIKAIFDNSERVIFQKPFDGHRYVVGISSKTVK